MRPIIFLALLGLHAGTLAQSVTLVGMFGPKALVIVDGAAPKSLAVGERYRGVTLVSTEGDQAVLDVAGKRLVLHVGDTPVKVSSAGTRIVLQVGPGGHFFADGQINGKTAAMVVDTGATVVTLGQAQAQRMGIDYSKGEATRMSTANGVIPGWRVKLKSLTVGEVVLNEVDAVVSAGAMPYVLLGNNFLAHFQMERTKEQMVLDKR